MAGLEALPLPARDAVVRLLRSTGAQRVLPQVSRGTLAALQELSLPIGVLRGSTVEEMRGSTVEAAVRRETLEESGLAVASVRYLASQPWPFPGSLMIGCIARASTFEIDFDSDELEACRWFDRAEVQAMLAEAHPDGLALPRRFAIAHHLIKAFADGEV